VYNSWPIQTRPSLDLKTLPRFSHDSLSLFMHDALIMEVSKCHLYKPFVSTLLVIMLFVQTM
jgi:hypothetical protein